jgi:hypothetical protein
VTRDGFLLAIIMLKPVPNCKLQKRFSDGFHKKRQKQNSRLPVQNSFIQDSKSIFLKKKIRDKLVTQKALANRKHKLRYQNVLAAYHVTLYH